MNGVWGLLFWLGFFALLVWAAVTTRRHDRRQELDVYRQVRDDVDRMGEAPW